jgi:small subunit ribosomal protein S20
MANKSASKKDIRQSAKHAEANKSRRTFIRTCVKNVNSAIVSGNKDDSMKALKTFEKQGMKAVSKGLFHIKTIARKVSRLYSQIKKIA